jgi:hypothetical protein
VDVTTWPRRDAECSPERGSCDHPARHPAGQPIIAGWAYRWICQRGFDRDSWTAPVDAARLHPLDDTDQQAARQVRALLGGCRPAGRCRWWGRRRLRLRPADPGLADLPIVVLVRLRADRCVDADRHHARPVPPAGRAATAPRSLSPTRPPGRPDRHAGDQRRSGRHRHRAGVGGLHPNQQRHPGHGTRGPRPIVRGTIGRVAVERVPARTRPPKVLWWWAGPGHLDLDLARRPGPAGSTWSTPSGSGSRRSAGRPRGPATPPRPTGGPGWSWPQTPSRARPARLPATSGWGGSGPAHLPGCHRCGSAGGSATSGRARLAGGGTEILRALPGPAKGHTSGPATRYPAIKKPTRKPHKKP